MRLKIASRQSDLAKIQSYTVAAALCRAQSNIEIEFEFRLSFGDRHLDIPMDGAQEKGLFTQDFYEGLKAGQFDMVIHSWKDLPVESRPGTSVVATLPRADVRDLLLVKKTSCEKKKWQVLSSSPRRSYNLQSTLGKLFPGEPRIEFAPIRGNILTRLNKLMDSKGDALILAKAAMDRLLEAREAEFAQCQKAVRQILSSCNWSVLPLAINPAAAAQGALAIEIADNRPELVELLKKIQCQNTFDEAQRERQILASYGGGCHQKIGVTVLHRDYGEILILRGLTDSGTQLNQISLQRDFYSKHWQAREEEMFPVPSSLSQWYERRPIHLPTPDPSKGVWVARAEAFPKQWQDQQFNVIWTSGLKSWQSLARRGIWVNGCAESMGEQEDPRVETLCGQRIQWLKLTHQDGYRGKIPVLATYQLKPKQPPPLLEAKTYFYWMSGSSFKRAQKLYPGIIANSFHGCGPGNTFRILQKQVSAERLRLFLNYDDWYMSLTKGEQEDG